MRVWLSACVSASMRSAPVALWDGGIRALSRSEGHTFYINSHHQTLLSVCVCVWVSENVQLSGVCGSGRWEKVKWEIERERERVIVRHLLALPSCLLKVYSFIRRQSCSAHNVIQCLQHTLCRYFNPGCIDYYIYTFRNWKLFFHFLEVDQSKKKKKV